jgi:hypothetical protein
MDGVDENDWNDEMLDNMGKWLLDEVLDTQPKVL